MNLKKCPQHGYTLKENCQTCNQITKPAHYKFLKIRNAVDKTQKESKKELE